MDLHIIGQNWPPVKHNIPVEEPPPPPFGHRQNRERECAGCGLIGRWAGCWCPTCRADVPAVEPRSVRHLASNRAWAREVTRRLDLLAVPAVPVANDADDWACLRCGDDVEDPRECWCVACQRDLAKGA